MPQIASPPSNETPRAQGTGRTGTSAQQVLDAAARLNERSRAVSVEVESVIAKVRAG